MGVGNEPGSGYAQICSYSDVDFGFIPRARPSHTHDRFHSGVDVRLTPDSPNDSRGRFHDDTATGGVVGQPNPLPTPSPPLLPPSSPSSSSSLFGAGEEEEAEAATSSAREALEVEGPRSFDRTWGGGGGGGGGGG